jgi:uncharacterized protein YfaS (alpha-2-macroglobulin family)
VPLTFVVERPDGVEYRRTLVADQGLGGHGLTLPIAASAPTGTWHVHVFTDPKRAAVGETTFLVEDYVPERIEFDLSSPSGTISKTNPATINLAGRFLYGAPASALDLEGDLNIAVAAERSGFAGYQFGLDGEDVAAVQQPLDSLPSTDDAGKATFKVDIDKLPSSTHPLEARIAVRMAEPGGRAVEHKITLPVTASGNMIGVKPLFLGRSLADGASAAFDVVVVAPNGTAVATKGLHYELLRVETHYQFYKRDGSWHFEPVKTTSRLSDGALDTAADKPGHIALPVNFGRYQLNVTSPEPNGPTTSVTFDAGWYVDASADTPDMLETALDKSEYRPGDTMTVAVTARSAGRLTLNVIGDKLLASQSADVKQAGVTQVKVPVGTDWGSGAYIVATLRRPLDAPAQRMPGRAIGVQWFSIDRAAKTLTVELKPPALLRPNTTLHIPVKIDGLKPGDEARIAVAAVDVGILNLTNYKPPSPNDYYLGQRALAAEIRDLYGDLIDGMQGTRGQIRTGGDAGAALQGNPPTGPPLSFFSGIVTVGADGSADVAFDIPDFAGTVRVMAVAWTKDKVGQASTDVIVRDPVVLTATLPRFLLPGDRSTVHLDLDNVEGQPGDYAIMLSTTDAKTDVARQGARRRHDPGHRQCRRQWRRENQRERPRRLCAGTQLHARGAAAGANFGAAHGEADRQGRQRHAVERYVCRSGAGYRRRFDLRRFLGGARRGKPVGRARPLSVSLLGADHEPRDAAALCRPACQRNSFGAANRRRRAGAQRHRGAADAAGFHRIVRPVGRRRQRRLARLLRHRLFDPRA